MLIRLKPQLRRRILLVVSLAFVVIGARFGVSVLDKSAAAKITPLTRVNTSEKHIGIVVELYEAKADAVKECLSVMESVNLKATWFCSATFIESNGDLVKEIASKGHEFGLSGTDDKPMDRLKQPDVEDRLMRAKEAILKQDIEPMPFFYAPLGRFSDQIINSSFDQGFYSVKGSIDGKILKGKIENAVKKAGESVRPGDILVLRVGKKGIVPKADYIEAFAQHLSDLGYAQVKVSDLVRGIR